MDEEIERLIVSVRADTSGFRQDCTQMGEVVKGPLSNEFGKAGRVLERTLAQAIRTGKLGFDDLKRVALSALAEIAAAALTKGIGQLLYGSDVSFPTKAPPVMNWLGIPGRATGGPVSPGAAYMVGERGPEMFVPTSAGRVETLRAGGGGRDVRVAIRVDAPAGSAPEALARSGRQVARAVRQAIEAADR
jgi:phage-related minor tail protein